MLSTTRFSASASSSDAITLYHEFRDGTLLKRSIRLGQLMKLSTIAESFEHYIGNRYDVNLETRQYLRNLSKSEYEYAYNVEEILKHPLINLMSEDSNNLKQRLINDDLTIICLKADSAHLKTKKDLENIQIIDDTSDPLYLEQDTILHKKIGKQNVYLATSETVRSILSFDRNEQKFKKYYIAYSTFARNYVSYETKFKSHFGKM